MPPDDRLKRLTETVLTGRATSPWPWGDLRARYFPAESDEQAREQFEAWAKKNAVNVHWSESEPISRTKNTIRVVVLEPRRRPPIKRRP